MRYQLKLLTAVVVALLSSCSTVPSLSSSSGCLGLEGEVSLETTALSTLGQWADTPEQAEMIDNFVAASSLRAVRAFEVNPSVAYYDDRGSANAFAHPANTHGSTDGSIRLGVNLVHGEFRLWRDKLYAQSRVTGQDPVKLLEQRNAGASYTIWAIIAHEAAHIMQIKNGAANSGRNTELQADFLAGWYFARMKKEDPADFQQFRQMEDGLMAFMSRGDYDFNSAHHHGTPEQRMDAFRRGFNIGPVTLSQAWSAATEFRRQIGG